MTEDRDVVERGFAWTATDGYKHYPPYVNLTGNRLAVRGPETEHPDGMVAPGPYVVVELPSDALEALARLAIEPERHDGDNRHGCTVCWDISCEGCQPVVKVDEAVIEEARKLVNPVVMVGDFDDDEDEMDATYPPPSKWNANKAVDLLAAHIADLRARLTQGSP